jgi:hypothetical protein
MPQYFFAIRAGDEGTPTERAAELTDDAAAFAHACRIVGELMQSLTHADRNSLVEVRDETRPRVFRFHSFRPAPKSTSAISRDMGAAEPTYDDAAYSLDVPLGLVTVADVAHP